MCSSRIRTPVGIRLRVSIRRRTLVGAVHSSRPPRVAWSALASRSERTTSTVPTSPVFAPVRSSRGQPPLEPPQLEQPTGSEILQRSAAPDNAAPKGPTTATPLCPTRPKHPFSLLTPDAKPITSQIRSVKYSNHARRVVTFFAKRTLSHAFLQQLRYRGIDCSGSYADQLPTNLFAPTHVAREIGHCPFPVRCIHRRVPISFAASRQ